MKLNVDKEADALYLRLDDSPIVESEEVSPGVVLDYNEANEVVGVEMLHLSKRSSNPESVGVAVRDGLSVVRYIRSSDAGISLWLVVRESIQALGALSLRLGIYPLHRRQRD